ncbi:acyl-CoA reductase [Sphingobacterium sp.]|uniref:acyl-CoA reductase n=1 Tax=Sphingobacterium sp. TaxID=341027 RepID=UPI00289C9D14|nr:acyl-CoA reductase [Sphingobacterium sp.]
MVREQRIQAFSHLGSFLASDDAEIQAVLDRVERLNPWYTSRYVAQQFKALGAQLTEANLNAWLADFPDQETDKVVGLVLAGNLPLVGFHDILCVLITGFKAQIKASSDDAGLTKFVLDKLVEIEPAFADRFAIVDILKDFDLVIATGSNNSARYFEHYFGKKPHIIRKNRNSIAVLSGEETEEQLKSLGHDIFDFFGLGCRSVSKVFIPENYDVAKFFEAVESFNWIKDHFKYNNNYDFNKSIYLINKNQHFDNGFLLLKEDESMASPLAVVHYERYSSLAQVEEYINNHESDIQCVTSAIDLKVDPPVFPLGSSQCPALDDYADGVNTLEFLRANQ